MTSKKTENTPCVNTVESPELQTAEMLEEEVKVKTLKLKAKQLEMAETVLQKETDLRLKALSVIEKMLENNQMPSNEIQIKILETAIAMYDSFVREY